MDLEQKKELYRMSIKAFELAEEMRRQMGMKSEKKNIKIKKLQKMALAEMEKENIDFVKLEQLQLLMEIEESK
jgi:hypothetical protein